MNGRSVGVKHLCGHFPGTYTRAHDLTGSQCSGGGHDPGNMILVKNAYGLCLMYTLNIGGALLE